MASHRNTRHTVAAEIKATTPATISWRASSAQLQRDSGTPLVAGSSQARALISACTEGGKDPGPARALPVLQPLQSLLEEPLPPAVNHLRAGIQPRRDLHIGHPLRCHHHNLGSHHPPVRVRVGSGTLLQLPTLISSQ